MDIAMNIGPLKPENSELAVGGICFLVVFVVLAKVLLPRIARTIAERDDAIEGGLVRAEGARGEAQQLLDEYRKEINDTRVAAAAERQHANEVAAANIAEGREEGQRIREELVSAGRRDIASERALAEAALRAEVGMIATDLAGKVVGEPVGEFVAGGDTVERFLAELDAAGAAAGGASTRD